MKKKTAKEPGWGQIGAAIGSKIEKECKEDDCKSWKIKGNGCGGACGGALYGLGFLGSLVYFITTAPDFWSAVIGVLKAIFWPAFIAYGALKFLGM